MSEHDNSDSRNYSLIAEERRTGGSDGFDDLFESIIRLYSSRNSILRKQDVDILSNYEKICSFANDLELFDIRQFDLQSHSIHYYEGMMQEYKIHALTYSILLNELLNLFSAAIGAEEKEYYSLTNAPNEIIEKITELKEKLLKMLNAPRKGKQTKAEQKAAALKPYFDEIIAKVKEGEKLKKSEQPKQDDIIQDVWTNNPEIKQYFQKGASWMAFRKKLYDYKNAPK